ncbi:methyltransferase domain-containing protein [Nocardiopsis synnemataformans]|uniref:methyltransferase domain-containing protein n=1 Tax=Nocardiopsis synnemataformans TaxID=61305 RepID=UPI003EBF271B
MTPDHASLLERRNQLAAALETNDHVREAFAKVPRHMFIPDRVWPEAVGDPLDRRNAPQRWADLAYADAPVITQVNDGHSGPMNIPTSSSSAPSVMAAMIEAAGVGPGQHVLEVGTGTGYNAAILCELVGPAGEVTTVEVDAGVAGQAADRLRAAGYAPCTVVADGAAGYAEGAPYDVVIATCAVVEVPRAWIEQTRPGGVVVTPWAPAADLPGGTMARLVVSDRGSAQGRFAGDASFMPLRDQRARYDAPHDLHGTAEHTWKRAGDARDVVMGGVGPQLALMVPGVRIGMRVVRGEAETCVWLSALDSPSWARLYADGRVAQGGPRPVGEEVIAAHEYWTALGCPELTEYGLTVTASGEHTAWFGAPSGPNWLHRAATEPAST